jgi:ATP-dependent RNA helicase RhlE
MPFSELGLSQSIVRGVRAVGYSEPTPIQTQAIPAILSGRDLIGIAQTGTGKTAAFVLPILEKLKDGRGLRCLVLTPTRELAAQVETSVRDYARFMRLRGAAIYGGVSMGPQIGALRRGVDIVVATPGRLLDHMNRRTIQFSQLQMLVLDEADRMLDMGFLPDIKRIIESLPRKRQTLLFSATIPQEIEQLARQILVNPALIEVGRRTSPAEGVAQFLYPVSRHLKMRLLLKILESTATTSVLVFTRTKNGADKVARILNERGHSSAQIHGDRSQSQRSHSLHGFRTGRYKILVATDIAARGLDIEGISHVINYDVPATPEDYVHRIGRTARAQTLGDAFTIVSPEEEDIVRDIERVLKKKLPRVTVPDFDYRAAPPPRPQGHQLVHSRSHSRDRRPAHSPQNRNQQSHRGQHSKKDRHPQGSR